MKYFLDTEFIEGFHKPFLGKRRHHIDLISIGIVAEDGREYQAISNEYRYKDADPWVQENVISKLYTRTVNGDPRNHYHVDTFHKAFGKSNVDIVFEIAEFMGCWRDIFEWRVSDTNIPEIYAYYADYDWVLFCSLFGRMINLPKGFPMYCNDLKQVLDQKARDMSELTINTFIYKQDGQHEIMPSTQMSLDNYSTEEKVVLIKAQKEYPAQENEHSAIDDARWNKKLYEFLQTI